MSKYVAIYNLIKYLFDIFTLILRVHILLLLLSHIGILFYYGNEVNNKNNFYLHF